MFPNLRLIIGAAIATIALVIVMGSGVLSFRDPYRSIGDVPDVRRPLVQHSIVENPDSQQFRVLAYARRSDELQRLLDLPTGPLHAYAPEAPTAYTFKVTPPADDPSPSDEPTAAAEEANPPETQASGSQPEMSRSASLSSTSLSSAPEEAAEPPVATSSSESAEAAPATAPPALALAPIDPAMTSGAASTEPPGNTPPGNTAILSDETGSIPASSVPAIEHPPLPPTDPREAHNRLEADSAAARPATTRTIRAKPRKIIRAVRILPRRATQGPVTPFGPRQEPTPSETELFNQRPWNIQ